MADGPIGFPLIEQIAAMDNDILIAAKKYTDDISISGDDHYTKTEVDQIAQTLLTSITAISTQLQNHIADDQYRWQNETDANTKIELRLKQYIQDVISGTTPQYDYTTPVTVIGTGGLITLAGGDSYIVPANGAIRCESGGLLGVAALVQVNGETVWTSPLQVLGIPVGGDENPSNDIPVNAGDEVYSPTLLGLGQTLNVTYYPRKA